MGMVFALYFKILLDKPIIICYTILFYNYLLDSPKAYPLLSKGLVLDLGMVFAY